MTRKELVADMTATFAMTKKDAEGILSWLFDTIDRKTVEDGVVHLGHRRFRKVERKGRQGRNPQTGEAITIPPKTLVVYRSTVNTPEMQ